MTDISRTVPAKRIPWNKGKIVGAKPPLRPKHVWSIRTKLQIEGRARDLALFNLAIDSKLRGCDLVALRVDDVAASGYAADRATVRQKKTGRPVKFELTEATRQAVDDYLKAAGRKFWRLPVCWPPKTRRQSDNPAVRTPIIRLGCQHRIGPAPVRDSLSAANKGDPDISAYRQSTRCPALVGSYENRKHGPIPGN
jgi:integrase